MPDGRRRWRRWSRLGLPFAVSLSSLRFRRIWALTKLSFKEAIRNRVLYGFSALLLVFLFGSWFIPHKPEDQVRTYVGVVYWVMKMLLLLAAVILAAFSIPTDIRTADHPHHHHQAGRALRDRPGPLPRLHRR